MKKDVIKKALLIFACGIAVGMILSGCASVGSAQYVVRHCPVKRVAGEDACRVVRDRVYYDGKRVYIVGNCWRDAQAVARWCKALDISYTEKSKGNHVWLEIDGARIEYIDGIGLVRR